MTLLGLTGGVGMGKSTAAAILSQMAIPVIDTDALARQLVEPGQPALQEIQGAFGPDVIGPDGRLRRDLLAQRVFPNPPARQRLEAILHPRIRTLWKQEAQQWRSQNRALGVVVIPLLFETDAAAEFDAVICVACSAATQSERLQPRGWSEAQIQQRIASQMPIERKMALAQFVIWTEGTLHVHREQLNLVLGKLGSIEPRNGR